MPRGAASPGKGATAVDALINWVVLGSAVLLSLAVLALAARIAGRL